MYDQMSLKGRSGTLSMETVKPSYSRLSIVNRLNQQRREPHFPAVLRGKVVWNVYENPQSRG